MICPHSRAQFFSLCPDCGVMIFPDDLAGHAGLSALPNYFEIFKLSPQYAVDKDLLQKRFYELSRIIHPDRFASNPDALPKATHWFAIINTAVNTLKSDSERAQYLFELANFGTNPGKRASSPALPPDLAVDYFDLQEKLEDDSLTAKDKRAQLETFEKRIHEKIVEADRKRQEAMSDWDKAGSPLDVRANPFFEKADYELKQRAYLNSMALDLEKKCLHF